jgi:hypothetical protein
MPAFMNGKGSKGAPAAKREYDGARDWWVNFELDEALTLECKLWKPDFEELDSMMVRFIEEGYKVQLVYDALHTCHAAYAFVVGDNTPNKGLILTGRGSAPIRALRQLLFKHYKALDGVWPRPVTKEQRKEFDD